MPLYYCTHICRQIIHRENATLSENITGKNATLSENITGKNVTLSENITGKNVTLSENMSTTLYCARNDRFKRPKRQLVPNMTVKIKTDVRMARARHSVSTVSRTPFVEFEPVRDYDEAYEEHCTTLDTRAHYRDYLELANEEECEKTSVALRNCEAIWIVAQKIERGDYEDEFSLE